MIPKQDWKYFGTAGHLIIAPWCRFHLTTQVGPWLISTIGEYVPDEPVREIFATARGIKLEGRGDSRLRDYMLKIGFHEIGWNRLYETMVFKAGFPCKECSVPHPNDYTELDMEGYDTEQDAQRGHDMMCARWATKDPPLLNNE